MTGVGCIAKTILDEDIDAVGRKDLDGARKGRLGQGMGVHTEIEGPFDPLRLPVFADGLTDGEDMRLVEAVVQRRPPVPRRSEGYPLGRVRNVRAVGIIRRDKPRNVRQHRPWRRFAGKFMHCHTSSSFLDVIAD